MNKKSQIPMLWNVFALITLFIIIVVFWFLLIFETAKPGIEKQVISAEKINEENLILLNYLRTPVKVNEENKVMTIADLIILSIQNNNYEILENKTGELFDINNNYWVVSFWKDENLMHQFNRESFQPKYDPLQPTYSDIIEGKTSETFIPGYNNELIKVFISVEEGIKLTDIEE